MDNLIPVSLPPGISRNGTRYQSKGRWYDSNLVRFAEGTIKPVGGWRRAVNDAGAVLSLLAGTARAAIAWRGVGGDPVVAVGTNTKLYSVAAATLTDITPTLFTTGAVDSGATGSGSYGVGAYGVGSYGFGASTTAITEAATWQLDTFGGYLVGVCTSDLKPYLWLGSGVAVPLTTLVGTVACTAGAATFSTSQAGIIVNGSIVKVGATSYTVSAFSGTTTCTLSGGPTFVAAPFSLVLGPTTATGVVVTPERFIVALGVDGNVRRISWPSQESTTDWTPTANNTAGGFNIATKGRIMCGARLRNETAIWTDTDMHVLSYIGGTLVYRIAQAGDQCGIIAPNAKAVIDTSAMWMGRNGFFMYDGFVKPVPCAVHDRVFSDMNLAQSVKIWAMSNAAHNEVWFFYPSAGSQECDRYVGYNYVENHWIVGGLHRSAGCDAGAINNPVMVAPSGEVLEHEIVGSAARPSVSGEDVGVTLLTEVGQPIIAESAGLTIITESGQIVPFLESGPWELDGGDRTVSIQRIVPDDKTKGDVQATIYAALRPDDDEVAHGPYALSSNTPVRVSARQARLRLDESNEADWRVGVIRFGVVPSSRR